MMNNHPDWLIALHNLILRFSEYGISHDLAGLSVQEAYGLYCFLQRMSER